MDLYAPLIFQWGCHQGLNPTDASDLVQEVLTILVTKLPEFEYDPTKQFRSWLRTVTINKANDFHRKHAKRPDSGRNESIQNATVTTNVDLFAEAEYRTFLVKRALELMQTEFPERTWKACWQLVVDGRPGREIAADLGISESSVYVSKSRVMKRLREEMEGLLG